MAFDRKTYMARYSREYRKRPGTAERDKGYREKYKEKAKIARQAPHVIAAQRARHATPRGRFTWYRAGARQRKLIFVLTFDQFKSFWKKPCTYCGAAIETIGLDRVDNSQGYTLKNVAACCGVCNLMKRAASAEEFISHCRRVSLRAGRS